MIYILYNISNSRYQKILADTLEYSIVKSGQQGQVIQIQSMDTDMEFESSIGLTYKLDSNLRKTLKNDQTSFNELYAFYKMFDVHQFEEDDLLFFVDPDMIFESKVDLNNRIEPGEIWGQRWMDYSEHSCLQHGVDHCPVESIMYPYLIRAGDAMKIKDYILTSGITSYNSDNKAWMMSMFVFTSSYEYGGLKSKLEDNLCLCNSWSNRDEDSPMLHYMQAIRDKDEEVMWTKHTSDISTFLDLPDPDLTTNKFDRRLVEYLREYSNSIK